MNEVTTPQFVTAPVGDMAAPQSVTKVAAVDTYLVQYKDGEGKEQVRLVFKVPGSEAVFVLAEKIQDRPIASTATGWFRKKFNEMLAEQPDSDVNNEEGVGSI